MTLLRRILAYNWKYCLAAVFCFAVFWQIFSIVSVLRQTERELAASLRQNAFPLEHAVLENDVVKAKQVLWQIKADHIHRLVFRSDLASESDRIFEELIIGPPVRSGIAAAVRLHSVVVNGAKIGEIEWTIDYIRLNREIFTGNAALFATVTIFFSILMILSNIGAMRTLIRLEESVSAANRMIAEGAQNSLEDTITAQLESVPQEGIGGPFTVLMSQVIGTMRQASRVENELALARALSDAATQVAHDIRSPLAALEVAAADAHQMPDDKRALIQQAVERMRGIADGMLERYRGQSAGNPATAEAPSIQSLAPLLQTILSEKSLQFKPTPSITLKSAIDSSSKSARAKVQPGEFKRLVSNLVNNAAESLIEESGTVRVSLSARDGMIILRVEDDGKGIPPEVLTRLGRRGESHGKPGGTGLGLHHARACAESWGGSLRIESAAGKGTAVTVSLPSTPASSGREVFDAVLIDDDALARATWRMTAERLGKRLRAFPTAAEFFRAADAIDRLTPVYMDSDLGEGVRGEEESLHVHELGFTEIYLATGREPAQFAGLAHLRGVIGKAPPWS